MGGEKIDIIEWDETSTKFIAKALSPAKVNKVEIKEDKKDKVKKKKEGEKEEISGREAVVYVNADQLSLAIGKEGQNVRLAAKLTGWKIDIVEEKGTGEGKESDDEDVIQPKSKEAKEEAKKEKKPTEEGEKDKPIEKKSSTEEKKEKVEDKE